MHQIKNILTDKALLSSFLALVLYMKYILYLWNVFLKHDITTTLLETSHARPERTVPESRGLSGAYFLAISYNGFHKENFSKKLRYS